MKKIDFNSDWEFRKTGADAPVPVTIPHDAMLSDPVSGDSAGGVNTGWYEASDCVYRKRFEVPDDWRDKKTILEFEGIYHRATVFVNEKQAAHQEYGYTGFFIDLSDMLIYGGENEIRVEVINSDQPNSRWYTGTGIYRPVWLYLLPQKHILPQGIKITTLDYRTPKIRVEISTSCTGPAEAEILDGNSVIKRINGVAEETERDGISEFRFVSEVDLEQVCLWCPETPVLYTCRVNFYDDVSEESFGVRMIECTPQNGFCINGKRVILRGACIHHDNGLLGACAYDAAEWRKIRLLKENGYNAVRSAHNPCSGEMLRACDRLGMLMVDEYVDMWYIHKTKYDYASSVEKNFKTDLKAIVDRDYNHPSVIMYSTGNEVSETAQKKGIQLCKKMTEYLHHLDPSRPVTCGVNIFFNFLSSLGLGVYSDKKAEQSGKGRKKRKAVGSEFFNQLAGLCGAGFMKSGAALYPCDLKTKDAFSVMDVAGYNYGIKRYRHDLKKYPDRIILGSETFCEDAYDFWEMAKNEKRLIGDFVWAGMDYLGETGIGAWEYEEYAPRFDHGEGWKTAGAGRLDLTGKPLAEMKYTRVAFGLDKIGIGVVPVCDTSKKHSPSAWKMSNAIESWSWDGCEGMQAEVQVYARAYKVSLYVNGECVGTKKIAKGCMTVFHTEYRRGELRAKAFDEKENLLAETALTSAGKETVLSIYIEKEEQSNRQKLYFVRFLYTDKQGILKPLARAEIKLGIEGGKIIGFGSACPYYPQGYLTDTADTYYGEAMAVIKAEEKRRITLHAESRYGNAEAVIEVD